MLHPDHNASPLNPIPPVVLLLAACVGLIEIAFQLGAAGLIGGPGAVGWRVAGIEALGFFDRYFEWMRESRQWPFDGLMRFVTFPLVHQGATHAIFGCVLVLAIGKFVGERFSGVSVMLIFLAGSLAGALAYGVLVDEVYPLIGVYPGVYGLLGALTWILWSRPDQSGRARLAAFQLVGVLLALQLVFRMIESGPDDWVADIGGFVAGFALSFVLSPGGGDRLRQWLAGMRNR